MKVNKFKDLKGHTAPVYALVAGATQGHVYAADATGRVVDWDLGTGQGVQVARVAHSVYAMYWMAQGQCLLLGHNYRGLHWLDMVKKQETHVLPLGEAALFGMAMQEDTLFVADAQGRVWVVKTMPTPHVDTHWKLTDKSLRTILSLPERQELLLGDGEGVLWRIHPAKKQYSRLTKAHEGALFVLKNVPETPWMISGGRDGKLKRWRYEEDAQHTVSLDSSLPAHESAVYDVVFHPQKPYFATASRDKTIKIWSSERFSLLKVVDYARYEGHTHSINKLVWLADGRLVSGGDDGRLCAWEIEG